MKVPLISDHEVVSPSSLDEALAFLWERSDEGWQPLAGGTDMMVTLNYGKEAPSRWLDVSGLAAELADIRAEGDSIRIGGLATMTALRRSALCREACPMIAEAAATVGAIQIQNRATVAGNIVNASPAGDTLPVWLALDAEIELASAAEGFRRVAYRDFTPSYRRTVRRPDELLTAVVFTPLARSTRFLFRKVGTRAAQAISKVVLAATATADGDGSYEDVRLAFGSMAATPVRATSAERAAVGARPSNETGAAAARRLSDDLTPIDDVRSTASYRMQVAEGLVREFLAGNLGTTLGA